MNHRAFTVLDVRSLDDGARAIEGIASTPATDRMGDIVDPLGAKFKLPMPLLWQHNHAEPVGTVEFAQPTRAGIPFKARIARVTEPGALRDRTDEAWSSVKAGLVRAVSIGFRALDSEPLESGGTRFKSWEWLELSLVTIPANAQSVITAIKALDLEQRDRVAPSHRAGKVTREQRLANREQIVSGFSDIFDRMKKQRTVSGDATARVLQMLLRYVVSQAERIDELESSRERSNNTRH